MVLGVQLVAANSSYAASDYDNLIHTSPSLYVYTDGGAKSHKMDISQSWLDELGQTYAKRLAAGIGWPSNLMSSLYDIKSSGSLGILMREDNSGSTVEVYGTTDPNAYCEFTGDAATGSFGCFVHAGYKYVSVSYFTYNTYGGNPAGCGWWWAAQTCSDNGMNVYTAPTVETATTSPTQFLYVSNADMSNVKFYYADFDTTYPTGYDGEVIPTQPPNATYVAMGDSFSSGEGNPPFEAGTATSSNDCHRSYAAYPRVLQNDVSLHLGATAFTACSGATTSTVLNGGSGHGTWDEGPQTQTLSADTQIVTITIGGNDIGFSDFASACVLSTCDSSTSIYATTMGKINNNLPGALKNLYERVLMDAPNTKVYVIDYPHVAPSAGTGVNDPSNTGCLYLYGGSTHWGNGRAAHEVVNTIDSAISDEVTAVQQEDGDYAYRLHYVSSNDPSSPFAGHTVCDTGDSYFQNVNVGAENAAYVFHPNANGQLAYKNLASYAITGGIA